MKIKYVKGDATHPIGDDLKIIAHICNDAGLWGAGFVKAISRRWSKPEHEYRVWSHRGYFYPFSLGQTQFVQVEKDIHVANMVAQHGVGMSAIPPIRYEALTQCLAMVAAKIRTNCHEKISVHMPRIGCGLAGGEWSQVEKIIKKELTDKNIQVYVYDYIPPKTV